ncbi:type VII secretion protein EccB [Mycolicibacterium vaccae]|nr:type VII secretion protein EccB [Mycolicibacterium vaccae]
MGIPGAPQFVGPPLTAAETRWTVCDTDGPNTTVVVGVLHRRVRVDRH